MTVREPKANTSVMRRTEKAMNRQGDAVKRNTSKNIDNMVRKAMKTKW